MPDTYTKIGFSSVTANVTASPNVHEYYPNTTLQFQQGDILGVYYPHSSNSEITIYAQRFSGPSNVKKHGNVDPPAPSELTLSELRDKINAFPLVSIVVSKCF